jgi:hypothetical protein
VNKSFLVQDRAHDCRIVKAKPEKLLRLLSPVVRALMIYLKQEQVEGRVMNTSRNDTIWLVRGQARRSAQRVGAGVLARAVAVAALLAGASVGLATQQAPAIGGKRPALTATVDATRLVALAEPGAPMPAARVAMQVKTSGAPESSRMLDPRPAVGRPHFTAGDPGQTGSTTPGGFRAAIGDVSGDWREEEFPRVEALDGRTLAGPGAAHPLVRARAAAGRRNLPHPRRPSRILRGPRRDAA